MPRATTTPRASIPPGWTARSTPTTRHAAGTRSGGPRGSRIRSGSHGLCDLSDEVQSCTWYHSVSSPPYHGLGAMPPFRPPIEPKVLKWARETMFLAPDEAARKLGVKEESLLDWEAG